MNLKETKIILASGSPRRIDMLREDNLDFKIIKSGCEEDIHTELTPAQTVMSLALRKALAVGNQEGLIIAADTIVTIDGEIIGKPKGKQDAFNILSKLNGRKHQVVSGVCLIHKLPDFTLVFSDSTDVYFKQCTESELWEYIESGEPMDKAGAYAIQGGFAKYVDHIEGAYDNVVGLPWEKTKQIIESL